MATYEKTDIPDLEDFSDVLPKTKSKSNTDFKIPKQALSTETITNQQQSHPLKSVTQPGFAGLKTGFLSNSSKPKSKSCDEEIKYVSAKKQSDETLRMKEVQDALNSDNSFLNNQEWVTEELLSKIESNSTLNSHLKDPKFSEILLQMQKNPAEAMQSLAKEPEMQSVFQQFLAVMGNHFSSFQSSTTEERSPTKQSNKFENDQVLKPIKTHRLNRHDKSRVASVTEKAPISQSDTTHSKSKTFESDNQTVDDILNNPELRSLLLDNQVQSLLSAVRQGDQRAVQRFLKSEDKELKIKIKNLVSHGLLKIEM